MNVQDSDDLVGDMNHTCCTTGRLGVWVAMQDGGVKLYSDVDGVPLIAYEAKEFASSLNAGFGSRVPRRPYWCAMHETKEMQLWIGMAAAGTTGTGILLGLQAEGDYRAAKVTNVRMITNHQKGAVRCIRSYGPYLFTTSDDNRVMVRNSTTGVAIAALNGHTSWVGSLCVSPVPPSRSVSQEEFEPQYLWSGAADGLRIWDIKQHLAAAGKSLEEGEDATSKSGSLTEKEGASSKKVSESVSE
eukprot:jgi/Bigna1/142618/aug1.71_g17326